MHRESLSGRGATAAGIYADTREVKATVALGGGGLQDKPSCHEKKGEERVADSFSSSVRGELQNIQATNKPDSSVREYESQ